MFPERGTRVKLVDNKRIKFIERAVEKKVRKIECDWVSLTDFWKSK